MLAAVVAGERQRSEGRESGGLHREDWNGACELGVGMWAHVQTLGLGLRAVGVAELLVGLVAPQHADTGFY